MFHHKLYRAAKDDSSQYALNLVASWCIGEYGELLVQACPAVEDYPGAPAVPASECVATLTKVPH